jgi:hypothetical protein
MTSFVVVDDQDSSFFTYSDSDWSTSTSGEHSDIYQPETLWLIHDTSAADTSTVYYHSSTFHTTRNEVG